ncbi:hypothetical protein PSH03_000700 [Micromonospora sp. PSH03]|uniref:hypothetical protein n=1 Tax=Micromonospora salmantinae TaxID=2911211 RepID=UPI001EE94BFE|nr:hypothetical protein [Micromonospora salmantinae]MCG5455817.1 hypothetical protein [Micromonospora salmantinae]
MTIGARRFVDDRMCSTVNADLAAHARRVLVLAPTSTAFGPMPRLSAQVGGSRVVVLTPDAAARTAIGRNALDPARCAATRPRRTQADEVAGLWA